MSLGLGIEQQGPLFISQLSCSRQRGVRVTLPVCRRQGLSSPAPGLTPCGGCTEHLPPSPSSPRPLPTCSNRADPGTRLAQGRGTLGTFQKESPWPQKGAAWGRAWMVSGPSLRHGRGPSLSRLNPPWQRPKCILEAGAEGGPPRVDPQLQEWRGFQTASVTSYRVQVPFPGTGCVLASCRSRSSPGTAFPSCPNSQPGTGAGGPLFCKGRQEWAPPHKEQERRDVTPTQDLARPPDGGVSSKTGQEHAV